MAPAARQEMGLDLWQALLMVRRRIGLVLAFAAVTTGLATLVILDLPERWTAEALLVLNDRASRLSELQSSTESLLSRTQADLSIIKTQAEILSSRALLPAVVRQLDLVDDPAFQEREQPPGRLASLLAPLVDRPARLRGSATAPLAPERAFDRAVERLSGAVSVVNDGGSYAIRIRAEALAPELAARIANALAAAYLDGQRAVQADAREAASAWLAGRLREQRLAVLR